MIALLGVIGALALEPVEPLSQTPSLQSAPCEGRGMVAQASRVVGTARTTVLHECGEVDLRGLLAIQVAGRWFVAPNGWIAFERVSSNIIQRIVFEREHLGSGNLANGEKAALYTIETINGPSSNFRFGRVIVCAIGPEVSCTKPVAFACDAETCTAPRLSRGVLIVADVDEGVQRFSVSAEPAK